MTFVEHLDEFRTRLLRSLGALAAAIGISMCFYRPLVDLATIPHFRAMSWLAHPPALSRFYAGDYWGSIGAVMKLSCIVGFFFASPLIARELWGFVSGGLYARERHYIRTFAPTSFLLFVSGCVFGYFVMIPYSLYAMVTALPLDKVDPVFSIGEYLQLVMTLTIVIGVVFQLPLVMVLLVKLGLATPERYQSWRKHAVVANVVGAAVIAPPDILSMGVFVLPLVLLYEIGIFTSRIALRLG